MSPESFAETTQALAFEAEYDYAKQINSDTLILPDEEMDEDDINTMLVPFDPVFAANPQGGNQDMDSHSDGLQPNPLPVDYGESGNAGERPMRVRVQNSPISYAINEICRICRREFVRQAKLIKMYSDFRLIHTWDQPHLDLSIK